jgi:ATP-dependent exoDNAse (exonuclease V) beta subunit
MDADPEARAPTSRELNRTTVVVAGAGTGKTTELVGRIVEIVRTGRGRLEEVAAITFTEAAAAELRQRVRDRFVDLCRAEPANLLARRALEEADEAAISTLHSFARRILVEHCAAAGLPPGFEVLDEVADACDFDARWARYADTLFEDASIEPWLVRGFVCGLRHSALGEVASAFHRDWDRLEDLGVGVGGEGGRGRSVWAAPGEPTKVDPSAVVGQLEAALAMRALCTDGADRLLAHIGEVVASTLDRLREAGDEEEEVLQVLSGLPSLRCPLGQKENWGGRIAQVREACSRAEEERNLLLERVRREVVCVLAPCIAGFVLKAAEQRREAGRLNFQDLPVHARRLLRHDPQALESLRRRYRWILVDEFQDTDPIQLELAALLAGENGASASSSARPGALFVAGDPKQSIYRFRRADVELFEKLTSAIGEPAVLSRNFRSVPGIVDFVNLVFADLFGTEPIDGQAEHTPLTAARPPVEAANGGSLHGALSTDATTQAAPGAEAAQQLALFARADDQDTRAANDIAGRRSKRRRGAQAQRRAGPVGPPVLLVGGPLEGSASEVRRIAARDVARRILGVVGEGWSVEDIDSAQLRPARFSDVAVLIPARTSLPFLEEAFDESGVPYRLEGAAMLWGSEEVRDVLASLRAAADPADQVAVLAALRSPGLACGDDDLWTWREAGGSFDPGRPSPAGLEDHPVARGMRILRDLHSCSGWSRPSEVVARACEELNSFELAFAHRRPRDHWQRVRWLRDQARLFDETSGGTLRAFLTWADLQGSGDRRATGIGPPDPDDDAVRVMTVHGAKGLEFPVVVLCGLERQDSDVHQPKPVLWDRDGRPEVRAGALFTTAGYADADRRDQQLDALERVRVLYVGLTRARDHLVVSLHHRGCNGSGDSSLASRLSALCDDSPSLRGHLHLNDVATAAGGAGVASPAAPTGAPHIPRTAGGVHPEPASNRAPVHIRVTPGEEERDWSAFCDLWSEERARLLASLRRQPVVAATALAGDAARGVALGLGARAAAPGDEVGIRIGRAVHEVLAAVELRDATGLQASTSRRDGPSTRLETLSIARARAQGIEEHGETVAEMVRKAVQTELLQTAAQRRHWREIYVAVPVEVPGPPPAATGPEATEGADGVGRCLLEGIVDLVFEEDDGLVVVDYKTDALDVDRDLAEACSRYELQVASYAAALERSTGKRVTRCALLFLAPAPPVLHAIEGEELSALVRDCFERAASLIAIS